MDQPVNVVAFGASTSQSSINKTLAAHAAQRLRSEFLPRAEIDVLDLGDFDLPVYSVDLQNDIGIPEPAQRFFDAVGAADAIVISYAEHNGLYTAAYTNLLDWASRIDMKVFRATPMVALATSPGPRAGRNVVMWAHDAAPFFVADVVGSLSVPRFGQSFDASADRISDPDLAQQIDTVLRILAARFDLSLLPPAPRPGTAAWDDRYADTFAAYGTEPNDFLRAVADRIPDGPVLVIGAGEGRNAVYLAELGHEVTAVDQSAVGLGNAAKLAANRGVDLITSAADLADYDMGESAWAGIVSIWAHVPSTLRRQVHAAAVKALRPSGVLVEEAYSPAHLDLPGRGGPPLADMLVTVDDARRELDGLDLQLLQEVRRDVSEGREHEGPSSTVQILATRRA